MLDAVDAGHLAHDQLAVASDFDAFGPQLFRLFHGGDEGAVLGDIVGRLADVSSERDQGRAVLGADHHADSGRTGIAATAPVEFERQGFLHRGPTRRWKVPDPGPNPPPAQALLPRPPSSPHLPRRSAGRSPPRRWARPWASFPSWGAAPWAPWPC